MAEPPALPAAGLSSAEAAARLAAGGANVLPTPRRTPVWRRFVAELVHFFALLFWVAGALAVIAGLPQLGIAVFVVVVLNGVFAFIQEQRAEHAAERLRDLLPRRATVVRDGVAVEVAADELVVGDLVVLAEGDRVSADLRLDRVHALAVDTSTLTGESVPAHPSSGEQVFAGCFVVEGEAHATVVATGPGTRLAGIARLTRSQRPAPSPLRAELNRVSRIIAFVAVAVGVVFFGAALLVGTPASGGFLFAIGVTVAVVPCGLLPTVTLSLAMGAQRMASRHALVRHLEAVETLGSTTFICTDKTGTLTRNEMAAVEVWMPGGEATIDGNGYEPSAVVGCTPLSCRSDLVELARVAARCSNGRIACHDGEWLARGDPMEAALHALARRVGVDEEADAVERPETARFPFDARRRRMSVIAGGSVLVKGAPDAVLPCCDDVPGVHEALHDLARRGLRVLAIASRPTGTALPASAAEAEEGLTLLGLVGLEDPPRRGAAEAIAACRRSGIRVAMVTGDHPETARAIADEVGLAGDDATVVVGAELPTDDDELGELIDRDDLVVARVSPEDKLRIATVLTGRGHVVAMTGDGVNDAPALREAAIGVAMGRSGTDVAREAADLVLLEDDFATIVAAIEQGRSTFANIRRFLTYHLTDNVAELAPFVVWALSGTTIPLAIGVLQVLALDIGTDVLPALALGAEPPAPRVLDQPPTNRLHLLDRSVFVRAFGVLGPVEALVELAAFMTTFLALGWRPGDDFPDGAPLLAASGAAFTAVVLGQVANAFACRSTTAFAWRLPLGRNRLLPFAIATELAMLVAFLFIGPLARLLEQAPPTAVGLLVALLAMPAVLVADTVQKAAKRVRDRGRSARTCFTRSSSARRDRGELAGRARG
ncbi:MAG: putative cation-transporting ATPase F [Acidimicrobiales bacterium]|nr:MAG: cation-transporting P-type ATPase [Actinomycetota bacterium]MBV6508626.1 putative cation-transporting ATPase F [Acidimicrobiales bacterium]RIK08077.1 MAG: haloacid dehalogenase [Acidobacteriota bacterium]